MKKIIFSLSALAALLLAGSCQRENLEPVETGSNTVTYSVQVPDAIATKANPGSVAGVTELVYEVYRLDANGEIASLAYEDVVTLQNGETKWDLELEFVNDQKFQVLFWAQKPNVGAYNTVDLREVSLNSATLTANVDNYAAFAGYDYVTNCVSHKEGKVTLVRPISQIQVGTDAAGLVLGTEESNKVNISLTSSSMLVKGLPTTYNVANGEVSASEQDVEYTVNTVPAGKFTANSKEYTYVAQNYVAFADAMGTTVEVDFTVTTSEGDVQHTVSNVPLKPNYRTNIVGNLITENADYSIDLEANWADEEYNVEVVAVSTAQELQKAIENIQTGAEGNIILEGDINLGALFGASTLSVTKAGNAQLPIVIPENKAMTLDLNGFTITTPWEDDNAGKHYYAFDNKGTLNIVDSKVNGKIKARGIFNYGKMTLESGTIDACDGNGGYGVRNYEGAEFVMNGGTIITSLEDDDLVDKGGYDATTLRVDEGATATINGGTINNICDYTFAIENRGTTTVNGGEFKSIHTTAANYGTLTINGGSFTCNGLEGITAHALWADAGTTTINGGTFNGKDNFNGFNVDASAGAVVDITGGKFLPVHSGSLYGEGTINVKGGEFFDDPSARVAEGFIAEKNGEVWVVAKAPVAQIGEVKYYTLEEAVAAAKAGDTITVLCNVTLSETLTLPADIIFNGNGKQINGTINAGGNLTFAGHTKVTSFSATYYNRTITIGEGACLEVTGGGRVTLGYGNTFDITGSLEDAKNADKANVQPSLIIPAGISITGGNDATMNVANAYVQIGSTTSKPGAANGKFTLNFTNSIAEFTKEFGFYEPTGGMTPTFEMSITSSVFTTGTKLCVAAANSTITVNNSNVLLGTYLRNSGKLNITNGSVLTGKTIQFGESGGNNGAITVDKSMLTIKAGGAGHAFDGKNVGSITLKNGAEVNIDYVKDMILKVGDDCTFTYIKLDNCSEIVTNAEELTSAFNEGKNVILYEDIYSEASTTAPYGNKYGYKMDGGVLDGNGYELDIECYGDDYGIMTSGGTIKNLKIDNATRAIMVMDVNEDLTLDNVNIGGDGVLYPINTGEAGPAAETAKLTVSNSTLAGWTSYAFFASATFTNVEFKQGTYYNNIYGRVLKPYVNTTLTNCSFVEHMNLDLSRLANGHKVTMTDCTVNGQAVTAEVMTVPSSDAEYDTKLFTVDLPSWATSVNDCIIFN